MGRQVIDAIGFGDNLAEMQRPVIPCLRTFTRYGKSGIPVSDWFPHVGGVIDEIAVVRSMWCNEGNHFPAVIETCTGHRGRQFDHPTLGQLGLLCAGHRQPEPADVREHRPAFVAGATDRRLSWRDAWPPRRSNRARRRSPICIRRRAAAPPSAIGRCRRSHELNREFRERYAINSDIAARAKAYELAARMQLAAPRGRRFRQRTEARAELYGIGEKETDDFGRQLLLARRLAERGVRFIQVCHAGGGNGGWDAHGDIKTHGPLCRATDKPIAGLIRDLKQRGMLDETLVVWSSEFGRSPWSQNTTGRDHNPQRLHASGSPAAASRAASSTAPPTKSATRPSRIAIITATCTPRFCSSWDSTTRRWKFRYARPHHAAGGRGRRADQRDFDLVCRRFTTGETAPCKTMVQKNSRTFYVRKALWSLAL